MYLEYWKMESVTNYLIALIFGFRQRAAGGYRNNSETFHMIPRLHLIVSDVDEIVISQNQQSGPKVIGFSVYPLLKLTGSDLIDQAFFCQKMSQYSNGSSAQAIKPKKRFAYNYRFENYRSFYKDFRMVDILPCQMKSTDSSAFDH
ncbi:putative Calpain-C [Daphnia magna]|uniref:Putative Calpain-C n=1 Tax=Daphnia magna TaxID=35525 RepID=A0A164U5L8_9CRUS|nr:putative Calpain-C [Daphnia magna]